MASIATRFLSRVGRASAGRVWSPAARSSGAVSAHSMNSVWMTSVRCFAASAAQVKELRAITSAPLSDCKKALNAEGVDGDIEKAIDWLRTQGVATAAKKASRAAADGLVSVAAAPDAKSATVIELNSETDFVARNEEFTSFMAQLSAAALESLPASQDDATTVQALLAASMPSGDSTVEQAVTDMVAKFRENLVLRRARKLAVTNGIVASYVHNKVADGSGKIASLVALEAAAPVSAEVEAELKALGHSLAMHVVAARPQFLSRETVDADALEREMEILREQARSSGKPDNIVEKMVTGRVNKFYKEVVLMEQPCMVGEEDAAVQKVVQAAGKKLGVDLSLTGFARIECGEGVEVPAED